MLDGLSRAALYAVLVWAPLASGAYRGVPLAVATVLVALALAGAVGGGLAARRLEWRRTPLDLPLALLTLLVLAQLALGHQPLVRWALAPPPATPELAAPFPAPALAVGTVKPTQTLESLLLFLLYASVYYLVVHLVRTRRQVGRLVRMLLVLGGLLAFLGLLDYLTGEAWLLAWRDHPYGGRLAATFVNPDHFASYLAMLICLGSGWLVARGRGDGRAAPLGEVFTNRAAREQAVRRYLPLVALVAMAVALVFTLSRGGLLGLAAGLLVLLGLLGGVGHARRSLVLTGVLLVAVVGYGGWIGFGPLLARFAQSPAGALDRWGQYVASAPMLRDFPLLGVGLGAYREIYFRYQPLAYAPHEVYYPYAHNDVLQFVIETGVLGAVLGAFLLWRLAADLVGAPLFGRGACPVDGGAGAAARRNDPLSVGTAVGALAGVAAVLAHGTLDFAARIPANGILAAALLGLATVALHTRLIAGREQLLTAVRARPLAGRAWLPAGALGLVAAALLAGWIAWALRGALAHSLLDEVGRVPDAARAGVVLSLDRWNIPARMTRAAARRVEAFAVWQGRGSSEPVDVRRRIADGLLAEGRADLRDALALGPTNPFVHHQLAWLEAVAAVVDERTGVAGVAPALAHAARAIALAPDNPRLYDSLARLAMREAPALGLRASREAVRRGPALLPGLVDLWRGVGLTDAEWLALVPETVVDRLDLALRLEDRRLVAASLAAYRAALASASEAERPALRYMLALGLARLGRDAAAQTELGEALGADPSNPELNRALGDVRARRGDPGALDNLRAALVFAEDRARIDPPPPPFALRPARLAALVRRRAGDDWTRPERYRRALARYLLERELWEPAVAAWRPLAGDPRDAEAQFGLGVALEGAGAPDAALEHLRRAVALDATATRYRERLARRLWASEQYFQAINEWRTLKAQLPRSAEPRVALGRAYEKIGERFDALREYREALELDPGHAGAREALARLTGRRP